MKPGSTPTVAKDRCYGEVRVQLVCTGTPTPDGVPVPLTDFEISANVPITPPWSKYPGLTPVGVLSIDPANGFNTSGFSGNLGADNGLAYNGPTVVGEPNGVNYGPSGVENIFLVETDGPYTVDFRGIPLDPTPEGRTVWVEFHIKLCDENGNSLNPFELYVHANVKPTSTLPVPQSPQDTKGAVPADSGRSQPTDTVTPTQLDLGPDNPCFEYQAIQGSAPANQPLNASLLASSPTVPSAASATLKFSALFPGCIVLPATGYQEDLSQFYDNDVGFTAPGFSPSVTYGTGFQAIFNNIPAGVSVFVQTSLTNALGSITLATPGTAVGSTGLSKLTVTNGSATAVWTAQTASITQTGTFALPVYFAYQSGVTSPSHITVVQSLGSPPGGEPFLQPPANVLQPVLFSINTGASTTPKLTATIDSRPCIVGVTFWTNNACSPSSGLPVNVVSDSAEVFETTPTFTSNGGLSFFGLTGFANTPSQTQIFPNAGNANPGTYPETMTITGVGATAGSSVTVPFTVTVLPPNNPVFELNAVFDAFSYQSETIAPGQIYTIFGSNFGPSTLVSGTLDTSGKLSTNVANTEVTFDSVASPLLYVVNGQLSGVAPFELAGKTSTNVQIVYNGLTSPAVTVPVQAASISIASADSSGGNGAVVINKDGTLNTVSNPASVGDTVVIYASYAGPFANGVKGTDGRTTTGPPYPAPAGTTSVSIGGVQATNIPYFGNAPGFLESVLQINAVIPAGVPSSPYNPLVIAAGGATSVPWTTIAVQ